MKPLVLKITGINSFNDEQIIDFKQLYNKGIFGIFGLTGSGKSSIIDSITLALYGKINRYEGKTGFKEFININREDLKAKIYFEFCIKNGTKDNIYSVERHFKKDEKGSIRTTLARLSLIENNSTNIIAEKSNDISVEIEKIIGLKYEDFIRAVVLPQGKFSEFLMLENKEKRNMLERIFMLEKYGQNLTDKINEKRRIQEKKFNDIEIKLKELEDIDENKIKEVNNLIYEKNLDLELFLKQLEECEENYINLKEGLNLKTELNEYVYKKEDLEKYTQRVKEMEVKLYKAQKFDLIKDFLYDLRKIENSITTENQIFENLKENFDKIVYNYNDVSEKYEKIKIDKDYKLPKLNELKSKLEQDIKIKIDIDKIDSNITEKIENLNHYEEKLNSINFKLNEFYEEKNNYLTNLDALTNFIRNNKIKIDFKSKVEKAVKLEEKYIQESQNITKKNIKIEEIKNNLDKLTEEKDNFNSNIYNTQLKIEDYKSKIQELKDKQSSYQNEISECESKLLLLKNEYQNLCDEQIILDETVLKKKNIQLDLQEVSQKYSLLSQQILKLEERLLEINNIYNKNDEDSIIFKIAQNLVKGCPCPVCGSKNHPSPQSKFINNITETLELEKNKLEIDLKKLISENEVNLNKKIKLETELESILSHLDKLELKLPPNLIEQKKYNLEELNTNIIYLKQNLQECSSILDENLKSNEDLENNLNKFKIKFSEILANIKNNEDYLKVLENELSNININELNYQIQNLKNELKIENFIETYNQLKISEKILEEKDLEKSKLEDNLNKLNYEIENNKNIIQDLEKNIISLKTSIKETKTYKNKMVKQLKETFYIDISSLEENLNDSIKLINDIEEKEKYLYNLKIDAESKKLDLEKQYNNSSNKLNILKEDKLLKEKEFLKKLEQNDFSSIQEAEQSLLSNEEQEFLHKKISSFNEKMQNYTLIITRITKSLEEKNFLNISFDNLKKEFELLEEKFNSLKTLHKSKIEDITALKINLQNLNLKLETKNNLLENFQKEIYKLDLLKELSNLTKGGVFVEYIAINQLKQIVLEAGQRLKLMTNNKFSIELKGSDFIIKDYHNGGITRSPKSLSGGEVFMTSLSLAIALSSKIQLTNQAPLETLFLDEGFGTLDNYTLDTVIYALESLQSQNVNVGIITHIEELKNRINSKILVDFDDLTRGAKITLE